MNLAYTILHGLKALGSASGFYRYTTTDAFNKAYINGTGGASVNLAATDFIPWLSASTAAVGVPTSSFSSWQRLASVIGRVNYTFDNMYLLNVNLRYGGTTSKLTNNQYGFFPGISAGWNMHYADFFNKSFLHRYISPQNLASASVKTAASRP